MFPKTLAQHAFAACAITGAGLLTLYTLSPAADAPRSFPALIDMKTGDTLAGPIEAQAGDAFTVRHTSGKRFDVRLSGITAPRLQDKCRIKGQTKAPSSGALARDFAAQSIKGLSATCTITAKDNRDNLYARCLVNGQDLAVYMVAQGYALPSSDDKNLASAQRAARTNKKGLWGLCLKPFE